MYNKIVKPLSIIFNNLLNIYSILKDWKLANAMPIFIKRSKTDANNYRPISVTAQISRIVIMLIRDQIQNYLQNKNLIQSDQYGFMVNLIKLHSI